MWSIVLSGIALGVLVEAWALVTGFVGTLPIVGIQTLILIWPLWTSARRGRGYIARVRVGTAVSVIAALIVLLGPLLLYPTVVFPEYWPMAARAMEHAMRLTGRPEAAIRQMMDWEANGVAPEILALAGFAGTVVTGAVASAILAIFIRAKRPAPTTA